MGSELALGLHMEGLGAAAGWGLGEGGLELHFHSPGLHKTGNKVSMKGGQGQEGEKTNDRRKVKEKESRKKRPEIPRRWLSATARATRSPIRHTCRTPRGPHTWAKFCTLSSQGNQP